MKYNETIKALIFDLDGVLVNASHWHYKALNLALRIFGLNIGMPEHITHYNGLPTRVKLEKLTESKNFPTSLHPLVLTLKQKFTLEYIEKNCAYDHEKSTMLRMLKLLGFQIAICTNSIRASTELMLKKTGLIGYCDVILSNEDVNQTKPNPEIYIRAFRLLKREPKECLLIEDSKYGKEAAYTSGGMVMEVENPDAVTLDSVLSHIRKIYSEGRKDLTDAQNQYSNGWKRYAI